MTKKTHTKKSNLSEHKFNNQTTKQRQDCQNNFLQKLKTLKVNKAIKTITLLFVSSQKPVQMAPGPVEQMLGEMPPKERDRLFRREHSPEPFQVQDAYQENSHRAEGV